MKALNPTRALLALTTAATLLACGGDDYLNGTIDQRLNLGFDNVRLHKQGGFLLVEYIRRSYEATETLCKLAADMSGVGDQRTLAGADFTDRVTLSRATITQSEFPEIKEGSLQLSTFEFEHGGAVSGTFFVTFDTFETLGGGFSGDLIEIVLQ